MGKVLNALNFILFVLSYAILVVPALIILVIADVIKENRFSNIFDNNIMQNFEG
jgi:hypothetical protein